MNTNLDLVRLPVTDAFMEQSWEAGHFQEGLSLSTEALGTVL